MNSRTRHVVLAGAILAILGMPRGASAQEATVTGTVTDTTGGVLPGVTIKGVNEASGNSFETVTDARGAYRLAVRIGAYQITATLAGFGTVARSLELLVGQTTVVNLQMAPSTVQESVTVTAATALPWRGRSRAFETLGLTDLLHNAKPAVASVSVASAPGRVVACRLNARPRSCARRKVFRSLGFTPITRAIITPTTPATCQQ